MSAGDSTFGAALPRRSSAARVGAAYLNVWLLLILVVGTAIVLVDGATRPFISDDSSINMDALQYEPYIAAYIFAAAMLPLVFAWARRLKAGNTESLFLWFILCTVTYAKDFSYVKIPNAPIFITDVVLALLLLSLFVWPRLRLLRLTSVHVGFVLAFFAMGVLAAARGISSGQDATRVLRDFAIVVYPLYMLVALYLLRSWDSVRRVAYMLIAGALLSSLGGLAWFIAEPGQRRYIAFSLYIAVALVMVLMAIVKRGLAARIGWFLAVALVVGVLLANMRTLYVDLALAAALLIAVELVLEGRATVAQFLKPLATMTLLCIIGATILLQTRVGSEFVQRTTEDLVSGVIHSQKDDDAQFRLLAWGEALLRFAQNPVVGEGYGVPFTFELSDEDPRPHNTYLTVLYKMGLLGALPLLAMLGYLFIQGWKTLRRWHSMPNAAMLEALLLSQFVMCVFGGLNLLLESPFLASLFWINMGMTLRAMRLLNSADSTAIAYR